MEGHGEWPSGIEFVVGPAASGQVRVGIRRPDGCVWEVSETQDIGDTSGFVAQALGEGGVLLAPPGAAAGYAVVDGGRDIYAIAGLAPGGDPQLFRFWGAIDYGVCEGRLLCICRTQGGRLVAVSFDPADPEPTIAVRLPSATVAAGVNLEFGCFQWRDDITCCFGNGQWCVVAGHPGELVRLYRGRLFPAVAAIRDVETGRAYWHLEAMRGVSVDASLSERETGGRAELLADGGVVLTA